MADGLPDGFEKLIDPVSVEAVLDVRCEDPTHVRGKETPVETFVRVDGYWRPWPRVVATIKNLPGHRRDKASEDPVARACGEKHDLVYLQCRDWVEGKEIDF